MSPIQRYAFPKWDVLIRAGWFFFLVFFILMWCSKYILFAQPESSFSSHTVGLVKKVHHEELMRKLHTFCTCFYFSTCDCLTRFVYFHLFKFWKKYLHNYSHNESFTWVSWGHVQFQGIRWFNACSRVMFSYSLNQRQLNYVMINTK